MYKNLTGSDIISFFESIIDDSLDADFELDLLNQARDTIESQRPWRMLLKVNSSLSVANGEDYTTQRTLPTDFKDMVRLVINKSEYSQFPLELRMEYENCGSKYCVDHLNSKFYVAEKFGDAYTIYICYIYQTNDLTTTTSPVWPARFQKLMAWEMAAIYLEGLDTDEMNRLNAIGIIKTRDRLLKEMVSWDARLFLQSMDYSTPIKSHRRASNATDRVNLHDI